jgi:RuvB-like protein 2
MASEKAGVQFTASQTVQDVTQLERIGAHSHITGLGLNELLEVSSSSSLPSCGLIGQENARKSMGIVLKLIRSGHVAGRAVLLAGPPSTGKTALAMALSTELGENIPFVNLSASTVYSLEVSKTEALTQAVRRAMGVKISEEAEIIQGEVVEIQIETNILEQSPHQTKASGRITLCTTDMETVYDLGSKMIGMLKSEKIQAGDVIRIDKGSGKITKLGRSFSRSRDYDAVSSSTKFVSTPEGELLKRQTIEHVVSLHEMDVINSRQQGFLALFAGDTGEIRQEIRDQIDAKVSEWREEGRATLTPGVLFIDEVHMLDMECFSFLNRALESDMAPVLVIATNRGMSPIRGTEYVAPHGIPLDLLDRLMIIPTIPYQPHEMRQILTIRCTEEQVEMDPEALELLTRIASETTLRYAMHLITVSQFRAQKQRRSVVSMADVERCFEIFVDVQRSTARLLDHDAGYLFQELPSPDDELTKPISKPSPTMTEHRAPVNEATAPSTSSNISTEDVKMAEG